MIISVRFLLLLLLFINGESVKLVCNINFKNQTIREIDIPEKTDVCTDSIPVTFSFNGRLTTMFWTKNNSFVEKSKLIECPATSTLYSIFDKYKIERYLTFISVSHDKTDASSLNLINNLATVAILERNYFTTSTISPNAKQQSAFIDYLKEISFKDIKEIFWAFFNDKQDYVYIFIIIVVNIIYNRKEIIKSIGSIYHNKHFYQTEPEIVRYNYKDPLYKLESCINQIESNSKIIQMNRVDETNENIENSTYYTAKTLQNVPVIISKVNETSNNNEVYCKCKKDCVAGNCKCKILGRPCNEKCHSGAHEICKNPLNKK